MYLFLGEPDDALSRKVRQALEKRGVQGRSLLHPFSESSRFSWRLDSTHSSSVIMFEDGTYLADGDISGVLLCRRTTPAGKCGRSDDRSYIQAEVEAAILGWLWSLPCPVINRLPAWLWYYPRPPLQFWSRLLWTNGLQGIGSGELQSSPAPTKEIRDRLFSTGDPAAVCSRACVVDQAVVWSDARPEELARYETALIEFTRCAGLSFLEIVVVKTSDGIGVKELDPFPDLSRFCVPSGNAITEALVKLFTESNRRLGSQ
jgi:hypothetical protein